MELKFNFHHIGYAVKSIEKSFPYFRTLGYNRSNIYVDNIQKVNICLLNNPAGPIIELVEGISTENSPIEAILKRNGVTPYHICYSVTSMKEGIRKLRKEKYILLFEPVPAIAFGNKMICYLFNPNVGLIELIENEISSI